MSESNTTPESSPESNNPPSGTKLKTADLAVVLGCSTLFVILFVGWCLMQFVFNSSLQPGVGKEGTLEQFTTERQQRFRERALDQFPNLTTEKLESIEELVRKQATEYYDTLQKYKLKPTAEDTATGMVRYNHRAAQAIQLLDAKLQYQINQLVHGAGWRGKYRSSLVSGGYFYYMYGSPLALFVFTTLNLLTLYNIFVQVRQGKKFVFRISWAALIIGFLILGGYIENFETSLTPTPKGARDYAYEKAKLIENIGEEAAEIKMRQLTKQGIIGGLAATSLFICYICVSWVPAGSRQSGSGMDAMFSGLSPVKTEKYDVVEKGGFDITNVAGGFENKVGEKTTFDFSGLIVIIIIGFVIAFVLPFVVCFKFFENHFFDCVSHFKGRFAQQDKETTELQS